MKILESETHLLRLHKGDEIIASLINYCKLKEISFVTFDVIGAVSEIELAIYDLPNKKYIKSAFEEAFEIASMNGNISKLDDKYIVHAHGVFSGIDFNCKAGHVNRATISATGEIILKSYEDKIIRKKNDEIGLNLLDIEEQNV